MFQLAMVTGFTFRVLSKSGEKFCPLEEYNRKKCGKLNYIKKKRKRGEKNYRPIYGTQIIQHC
jgi:hypothetical protein